MIKRFFISFFVCALGLVATGQQKLSDEQFFKNDFSEFIQPLPVISGWKDGSNAILIKDKQTFLLDAATGKEVAYNEPFNPQKEYEALLKPSVRTKNKDLYVEIKGKERRLTFDSTAEANPTISPDGNFVAFTKDNDLYVINLGTSEQKRLTVDGSDVILNGYASWVYMEEILGRASKYQAFWWSPDSKTIAFFRFDDSKVPVFTITDANTREGYVETIRYPKVGDNNPEVKVGFADISSGKTTWADFDSKEDQYFGPPLWKPDGALLVQWMNRKQNNLKVFEVSAINGSKKLFYEENSSTWIKLEEKNRFTIYNKGKNILIMSNADGWNHLYRHDGNGKRLNSVTRGDMFVTTIHGVDEKRQVVYFSGRTKNNSTRTQLFSVKLDGSGLRQLTPGEYNHYSISLSPDFSSFTSLHENSTTPKRLGVATTGKKLLTVADSRTSAFSESLPARTTITRVRSEDGKFELPVR
ncbi:MAG: S9 family peptidase, partial [Chitinophagaceae bacterium]